MNRRSNNDGAGKPWSREATHRHTGWTPDQGRAAELPYGGLPRKDRDTDSNADAFLQPECPDIVIILEEGKLPHPRCSRCDMLVPWRALKGRHHATAMCKKGAERKRRRMAEAELRDSTERAFEAY